MKTQTVLSLVLVLMFDASYAADVAPPAKKETGEEPSLELLQFLGEWETRDGKWVDPVAFGALTQAADDADARPEEEGRDARR